MLPCVVIWCDMIDLVSVQQEVVKQKSLNQTLYDNNQHLQLQLNGGQASDDDSQAQFLQLSQNQSQLMQADASNHVHDFFKMTSTIMVSHTCISHTYNGT